MTVTTSYNIYNTMTGDHITQYLQHSQLLIIKDKKQRVMSFDVITSIVSFLWAYTTAAHDITGERVRTTYDVTAACYHKRRTQHNVFCHTWY